MTAPRTSTDLPSRCHPERSSRWAKAGGNGVEGPRRSDRVGVRERTAGVLRLRYARLSASAPLRMTAGWMLAPTRRWASRPLLPKQELGNEEQIDTQAYGTTKPTGRTDDGVCGTTKATGKTDDGVCASTKATGRTDDGVCGGTKANGKTDDGVCGSTWGIGRTTRRLCGGTWGIGRTDDGVCDGTKAIIKTDDGICGSTWGVGRTAWRLCGSTWGIVKTHNKFLHPSFSLMRRLIVSFCSFHPALPTGGGLALAVWPPPLRP
jgi:hypothetical protein